MLKRIVIENYRSCLRTSIDFQPGLSVLIGPNGSGKTNILQAMMFLNKIALVEEHRGWHRDAVTVSSGIRAEFRNPIGAAQLKASVYAYTDESNNDVMTDCGQKWSLEAGRRRKASLELPLSLFLPLGPRWRTPRGFYHLTFPEQLILRRSYSKLARWASLVMRRVARYCAGMRYYGASQFTNPGSCPVSFQMEKEGERERLARPRGHARILFNMYSAQKADSKESYHQFMDVVGPRGLRLIDELTFKEVSTSSSDYSVRVGGRVEVLRRHRLLVVPQFRIGRQNLSPNQLSEGTFKTLALLFHVITEESSALLIEEPEVCIHHGLLSSILEVIKSYSHRKQIILSTHSDYVLDHVSPESVYRVSFDKSSGTLARHIRKTMTAKEYSALRAYLDQQGNLGEFWREGGLGDRQ